MRTLITKKVVIYFVTRTNLPKEVMEYPGFPFSPEIHQSFIGHREVLDYIESFAQHYQLHKYIKVEY